MDKSKLVYKLFKQNNDLFYIAEQLHLKISQDLTEENLRWYLTDTIFKYITKDSWLFKHKFELFDFLSSCYLDSISLWNFITDIVGEKLVIEYKENCVTPIRKIIDEFITNSYYIDIISFVVVFQNYMTNKQLLDIYTKSDMSDTTLKLLLSLINKTEIFNQLVFTKQITEREIL